MPAKVQARTGAQAKPAKPIMTDKGIVEKTGHGWDEWFARLDKAGAAKLDHKGITALLDKKWEPGPWWGQMIAVSYERARGIRAMNQKCDGEFSVSVTKVFPVSLAKLFTVIGDAKLWPKWMPKGAFEETSRTKDKYLRAKWKANGRISAGFTAKGADKAQVAIDIGKLPDGDAVETERAAWKKAMTKLAVLIDGAP